MLKKGVIIIIAVAAFSLLYYLTSSVVFSLLLFFLVILYGIWTIRFELGINLNKSQRTQEIESKLNDYKESHIKRSKDNPTI